MGEKKSVCHNALVYETVVNPDGSIVSKCETCDYECLTYHDSLEISVSDDIKLKDLPHQ